MKNTITNYKGEKLMHTEYATMDMIHTNNISKDDVKFILNARRAKKRAIRRRRRIADTFYFLVGITCFYLFCAAGGHIENTVDTTWRTFWESIGLMGLGLVVAWFGLNRGRHIEAIKEVAIVLIKVFIVSIAYIVDCIENIYNFFKVRFATK